MATYILAALQGPPEEQPSLKYPTPPHAQARGHVLELFLSVLLVIARTHPGCPDPLGKALSTRYTIYSMYTYSWRFRK